MARADFTLMVVAHTQKSATVLILFMQDIIQAIQLVLLRVEGGYTDQIAALQYALTADGQ